MPFVQPYRAHDARLLRRWPQFWALALVAPAALAVTSMSPTMTAVAIVVGFGLTTLTALAMTVDNARALRGQLAAAVRLGACSAVTCLGFGGLFVFSRPLAWAAIAAYAATAAWAHSSTSTPSGQTVAAPHELEEPAAIQGVTTDEARSMTEAELCHAWRLSFATLKSTRSLERRAEVVSLRQVILDEIEVRHPAGLQDWLRSGARAAGGPDRFLGRTTRRDL